MAHSPTPDNLLRTVPHSGKGLPLVSGTNHGMSRSAMTLGLIYVLGLIVPLNTKLAAVERTLLVNSSTG
jgi:hypothetical protein